MFGKESVQKEFARAYQKAMSETLELRLSDLTEEEQKEYWHYDKRFSPSSFPFCGLRRIYMRLIAEANPLVYDSFSGDYFRNVGIVAHTVLQRWLSRQGSFIGDYVCLDCKHRHEFTTWPGKCKKCGSIRVEHKELGGKYGGHMGWKSDHVFQTKKGKLYIVDYKTTTSYQIANHKKDGKTFPYVGNRIQAESYVPLAEDRYKRKFAGCILAYAARDNPIYNIAIVTIEMDAERKDELRKRMKKWHRQFELALVPTVENVKILHKQKLCCDKQFYKENVANAYNPCPLSKVCFKREKLVLELKAALKTYRKNQSQTVNKAK
jgi:hypothetical protein